MPKTIGDFVLSLLGWPVTDASCSACGPTDETPDPDAETSCRNPAVPSSTAPGAIGCCGATPSRGPFHDHEAARFRADDAHAIRPATAEDLDPVRRLLRRCSLPADGVEEQFGGQYAVAVSERSGQIVGVAGYEIHGRYGLIRSAAVHPAWQGRGIGAKLITDRVETASEVHGIDVLYTLTATAAEYFERFGFVRVDRSRVPSPVRASSEFSEVCPTSATVLRRSASTDTDREEARTEPSSIACNLTSRQRQAWRDEIAGSVLKGLEEIREMEDGFAFRFPGGEAVDEKLGVLSRWIAGERKCCPFYRFEVIVEPEHGPLWLRLRGREGVKRYTASELRDFDPTVPGSGRLREWFERG